MKYAKSLDEVTFYEAPKGAPPRSQGTLIESENDEMLAMGFFNLPPGGAAEPDYHDVDEAYFFTRGYGYGHLWVNGNDKEPLRYEIKPGVSVYIPAGVKHQMWNTGKEDIWEIWFFPKKVKVAGKLQKQPYSPGTWPKRSSKVTNQWYPKA